MLPRGRMGSGDPPRMISQGSVTNEAVKIPKCGSQNASVDPVYNIRVYVQYEVRI